MDKPMVLLLMVALYESIRSASSQVIVEDICAARSFQASCPRDHTIVIKDAAYGRMKFGNCVTLDMGHLGCQKNVTLILDRVCSGRETCNVYVPNEELEETRPCLPSLKSYLEVTYTCQQVFIPLVSTCVHLAYYDVTEENGYLASGVTRTTGCGSPVSPYQLHAKPGQTINITLIDFGVEQRRQGDMYFPDSPLQACKDYGTVEDSSHNSVHNNAIMICGGHQRHTHVMQTSAHVVNVSLKVPDDPSQPPFLIYFEVLGCADENPPEFTWFKRLTKDTASMGCHNHDITWHMKCEGHDWVGKRGNCSLGLPLPENYPRKDPEGADISYGLAIAIIIGAALIVCSLIVLIGIIRYRRRDHYDYNSTYNTQTMLLRRRPAEEYEMRCTCPIPPQHNKVPLPTNFDTTRDQQQHTMTIRRSPHVPRHYSLKKTVEVEGNDYEHIWQTPLPSPRTRKSSTENTQSAQNNNNSVGDNMTSRHTNDSIASTNSSTTSTFKPETDNKKPYYVTSKDILSGPKDSYGALNSTEQNLKNIVDSSIAADV